MSNNQLLTTWDYHKVVKGARTLQKTAAVSNPRFRVIMKKGESVHLVIDFSADEINAVADVETIIKAGLRRSTSWTIELAN